MALEVRYHFSQRFAVSARKAFDWCIDFDQNDHMLMGDENAERQIIQITPDTLILKDTFHLSEETVEKQKLVQIYLKELSWTSTHLTGQNKYSQFLYKITPQGKDASILNFTAAHLEYDEKKDAKLLADRLCKEDEFAWSLLAKAMAEELKKRD
ncbi:MAG: hypothetical protein ABSA79_09745 [Candidatus Bathyarchaeia archaeon]|jgi:hypothetical protein